MQAIATAAHAARAAAMVGTGGCVLAAVYSTAAVHELAEVGAAVVLQGAAAALLRASSALGSAGHALQANGLGSPSAAIAPALQAEQAAYLTNGQHVNTPAAWIQFMALNGSRNEPLVVPHLLYLEPEVELGACASAGVCAPAAMGTWADELALRALATAYGRAVIAVTLFAGIGATLATTFMPLGGAAVTDEPVVLVMVGSEGQAAGGDHWAPARCEGAEFAPDAIEVDAGLS